LKKAGVYYLATVEGDQPRVRPFGTVNEFEGRLYIQTGKIKPTSCQLAENPKAEICAFVDGEWIRVACRLVEARSVTPSRIAEKTVRILNKRNSRFAYSINRNPFLLLLNALPKRLQLRIIKQVLRNKDGREKIALACKQNVSQRGNK
jgi:uncharacterized pyridoxamine 5'-phosphate oxidase family protein